MEEPKQSSLLKFVVGVGLLSLGLFGVLNSEESISTLMAISISGSLFAISVLGWWIVRVERTLLRISILLANLQQTQPWIFRHKDESQRATDTRQLIKEASDLLNRAVTEEEED